MKLLSFVVSCYNEEENILETHRQLVEMSRSLRKYRFEFIYIDNSSTDTTPQLVEALARKDSRVTGIFLARNFGPEASGLAGLRYARGDAIITCVSDLQDPIELIPQYVRRWEQKYDVVIGVYTKTADIFWMAWVRKVYYRIFKAISNIDIPVNSSGICLMSRPALNGFLSLQERYRSNVGLRSWIGFKTAYIYYTRKKRIHGKSSYSLMSYLHTAERGFFGFSYVPLDSIIYLGIIFVSFSFIYLVYTVAVMAIQHGRWDQATGSAILTVFMSGVQLLAVSIIGKYIQVIVEETKHRPQYIIQKIVNNGKVHVLR